VGIVPDIDPETAIRVAAVLADLAGEAARLAAALGRAPA
jgi:hypothetical protein